MSLEEIQILKMPMIMMLLLPVLEGRNEHRNQAKGRDAKPNQRTKQKQDNGRAAVVLPGFILADEGKKDEKYQTETRKGKKQEQQQPLPDGNVIFIISGFFGHRRMESLLPVFADHRQHRVGIGGFFQGFAKIGLV